MFVAMKLSRSQQQYLLIGHCIVPFVMNFILNGLLGLAMFRGVSMVPVWGLETSAGPDTLGTCFFLPAISCLIVTPIVRRHVRRSIVEPLPLSPGLPTWLARFQRPLPTRAALFGLTSLALVGALVLVALGSVGLTELELTRFLWLKATFSAVLGAAITPFIGIVALADSASARGT
jgi:hypothetical protein